MFTRSILGASALVTAALAQNVNNNIANADGLELLAEALQIGSTLDGTDAFGASDEQAPSRISENNFINFCAGETLTNGLQITDGSCNGIPHGQIPAKDRMVSSILINPAPGDVIQSGQDFAIQVQMLNFQPGAFTNAFATYYSAPQFLDPGSGLIIGHTHVTVQDMGASLSPAQPLDPQQFAFFKGINDAGNGNGLLEAQVEGGLPPGNYRVCTLVSAANHQPVVMPVAQRGSQDDCTKFTVVGNDFDINDAAFNGEGGLDAAARVEEAVALGPGAIEPDGADEEDADAAEADAEEQGQQEGEAVNLNPFQDFFNGNLFGNNNNDNNQANQDQNQDNEAQDQNDNEAQDQNDNEAQGEDQNEAQGEDQNEAQGEDQNEAQGEDQNEAQGEDENQAQGQEQNQAQGNNSGFGGFGGFGGQPTADQLRQQAQAFAQRTQQNKRLARLARRTFVA